MQRVAVDIGGTFTDIVYVDDASRRTMAGKVRSTPDDIGRAVLDAVKKIGVDMAGVSLFVHGITAGLNAVAQRRGARVGLLTTAGFTDILEMTRGSKKDPYNNMWRKPEPLVPRHLRRDVSNGYVSVEAARRDHGVVIDEASGEVDAAATKF